MPARIDNAVACLETQGVARGDRVALWADNGPELACLIVACWRLGAVVLPLSVRLTEVQVEGLLDTMACHWVVTDRDLNREALALQEVVPPGSPLFGGVCLRDLPLDLASPATIVMTSGSTGDPKGVLHRLAHHHASALGSHENIPFGRDDTWLVSLPMGHMGGLALIMRALLHGGTLAFPAPSETLDASIRRTGATHLSLVPTQLRRLLTRMPRSPLKAVLVGGAACPPSLVERAVAAGLPIHLTYGSTEMCSQVTTTVPGEAGQEPGCSGHVLSGRDIKLNAAGEILVRGATCFSAYVTSTSLETPFDAEGWFATGDMGRLDASGRLFVRGRRDTMFISGGENIYPEEIEKALLDRLDAQACVVVPIPDEKYGRRPIAFVKTNQVLPLREDLALNLERFKWPDRLYPWPEDVPVSDKPDRMSFGRRVDRPGELGR
jgi:O-succinylbenzoic acid--CoA ligase